MKTIYGARAHKEWKVTRMARWQETDHRLLATDHCQTTRSFGCKIDFMVKLLRACVGMPRRKKAMKDVVSCEKLRGGAHSL